MLPWQAAYATGGFNAARSSDCFFGLLLDRLHTAGKDVELTVYPTASHAFDNPLGSVPPAESKGAQTVRHCSIREEPEGLLINASTHQPFSYKDPCVEFNPHVGYDAAATAAAKKSVKEFVSTLFKL